MKLWLMLASYGGVALLAAFASGWVTREHYLLQLSEEHYAATASTLAQVQTYVTNVNTAAINYNKDVAKLRGSFNDLARNLKNAQIAMPLALDCKPDPSRVQSLAETIAQTNTAIGP